MGQVDRRLWRGASVAWEEQAAGREGQVSSGNDVTPSMMSEAGLIGPDSPELIHAHSLAEEAACVVI